MTAEPRSRNAAAVDRSEAPRRRPARLGPSLQLVAPDTTGLNVLDAHRLIREQRLAIAISVWETKIGPWGLVLSQDPEPGSVVVAGSTITVVVAGRPHLAVPEVRGLPMVAAMDILRRAGLHPEVAAERPSRSIARGEVIATLPRAGSLVTDGTRVSLDVSSGRSPSART